MEQVKLSQYIGGSNPYLTQSFDVDALIKARESSKKKKEPRVIGHTKSGKPINEGNGGDFSAFDSKDHLDTAEFHQEQALYHNKQKLLVSKPAHRKFHEEMHKTHMDSYGNHVKLGYEAQKKEANDEEVQKKKVVADKERAKKKELDNHQKLADLHGEVVKFIEKNGGNNSEGGKKLINQLREKQLAHSKKAMVKKAEENDLIKGGEGSKGGTVIGHTQSGKPIYKVFDHVDHKDFTSQDHKDAAEAHEKKVRELEPHRYQAGGAIAYHKRHISHHNEASYKAPGGEDYGKAEIIDFEKGGEGSRGGKIIGHTKSGKPVYAKLHALDKEYKSFTKRDHLDAFDIHYKHARGDIKGESLKDQNNRFRRHNDKADYHDFAARTGIREGGY